jgi:N-acetylglucosaminyl-diphospho-decaprenol L-rhamnosyltransferase
MNGIVTPLVVTKRAPLQAVVSTPRRISVVMVVYMTGPALGESIERVLADPLVDEFVIVRAYARPRRPRRPGGAAGRPR